MSEPELTLEDLDRIGEIGAGPEETDALISLAREALLARAQKPKGKTVRVRIHVDSDGRGVGFYLDDPDWIDVPYGAWFVTADLPVPEVPEVQASAEVAE